MNQEDNMTSLMPIGGLNWFSVCMLLLLLLLLFSNQANDAFCVRNRHFIYVMKTVRFHFIINYLKNRQIETASNSINRWNDMNDFWF